MVTRVAGLHKPPCSGFGTLYQRQRASSCACTLVIVMSRPNKHPHRQLHWFDCNVFLHDSNVSLHSFCILTHSNSRPRKTPQRQLHWFDSNVSFHDSNVSLHDFFILICLGIARHEGFLIFWFFHSNSKQLSTNKNTTETVLGTCIESTPMCLFIVWGGYES